jgi:hypothetical protein
MKFWGIDIKNGTVTYDDISFLTTELNLREQAYYLKEDMLQIEFSEDFLIDVGWSLSFDENGAFNVTMVRNQEWDRPIFQARVTDVAAVKQTLSKLIAHHIKD